MRILILGANGMLGHTMIRTMQENEHWEVYGTLRSNQSVPIKFSDRIIRGIDVLQADQLTQALSHAKPDIVINCIGLIKQLEIANDPLQALPINSLLPHRLAKLCELSSARLIHISTDCVFLGNKGDYIESDTPDAQDLYGQSKFLGEVNYPNTITLRTSIIGHELHSTNGLINWFLSQENSCKGFTKAIFSGLPTVVLSKIIRDYVIPNDRLSGLYHIAADAITKYDLLTLVAKIYNKKIDIQPDDTLKIDRSLNAVKFNKESGYSTPGWEQLIKDMHDEHMTESL